MLTYLPTLLLAVLVATPLGCQRVDSNTVYEATLPDDVTAEAFLGDWYDEDGTIAYRVIGRPDGTAVIQVTQYEMWRVELKDIRFEDGSLLFAQYQYTPTSDDYKNITNPAGEHPFSGVRCDIVLTIDPGNGDQIHYTMTTPQLSQVFTGLFVRRSESAG